MTPPTPPTPPATQTQTPTPPREKTEKEILKERDELERIALEQQQRQTGRTPSVRLTSKQIQKRKVARQIIKELYETEKNYMNELKVLIDHFMTPFSQVDPTIMSKVDHDRVFTDVPNLYALSKKLYELFKCAMEEEEAGAAVIVDAFLVKIEYEEWNIYMKYMAGFLDAKQTLARLEKSKGEGFRELMK
ncbi:hypothetical protein HK104_007087, partial [Borealophlyctis nickersoniae]